MPEKVVVTRPRAQAEPLAGRIAAAGREVVVFPLLEIAPLDDTAALQAALADLERFALAAFVSPNAIDAVFALRPAWPARVPIAVLGEGSRAALARHGVTDANATIHAPPNPEQSDSENLLATLDLASLRGRPVLLVRGETGRELLGDAFRAAGAQVVVAPAYRRSVPPRTPELEARLAALLAEPNTWIVTSSEAMRGLASLASNHVAQLQQQHFLVPHARIAETARALGLTDVTLTPSGDEGLFAALQSRV